MKPVSLSIASEIFRNQFVRLYSVRADFRTHSKEYFVSDKGTRVGTLVLRDEHVLLVRQYRFLIDDHSWEIPGGGVEPAETPEEAALRECREEGGVICRSLVPLFDYRLGLDATDCRVRIFRCSEFSEPLEQPSGEEIDGREWVPMAECLRRVSTAEIRDLMTITALLFHTHPGLR